MPVILPFSVDRWIGGKGDSIMRLKAPRPLKQCVANVWGGVGAPLVPTQSAAPSSSVCATPLMAGGVALGGSGTHQGGQTVPSPVWARGLACLALLQAMRQSPSTCGIQGNWGIIGGGRHDSVLKGIFVG